LSKEYVVLNGIYLFWTLSEWDSETAYLPSLRRIARYYGCVPLRSPETSAAVLGMDVESLGKEYFVTINWKSCNE
jgi:hypothetical protein